MRPKKIVLLMDGDEAREGVTRFVLETRGFRVLVASPGKAAAVPYVDCVLGYWPCDCARAARISKVHEAPVVLMVPDSETIPDKARANQYLLGSRCTAENLLSALKIACTRSRGPRPQTARIQLQEAVA